MPAAERSQELDKIKDPAKRKLLEAKLGEYEQLPEAERESRLQLVQLWDLLPVLMRTPPAQRTSKLVSMPESDRKMIEDRLQQWDLLPPQIQQEVLENKLIVYYFMRLEMSSPSQQEDLLKQMPAESRKNLEAKLEQWRSLPQKQRQVMCKQFHDFFDLPAKEKERTLDALSDEERAKIEKSLDAFARLAPHQRQMCIESFRKFANLSKEERDQFLKNAERWRAMTPTERDTWRNLVSLLPAPAGPPMPGATPKRPPPAGLTPPRSQTPSLPGTLVPESSKPRS